MSAVTRRTDSAEPGLRGGPRPGLLLGERYRLEELLAVGGMGAVWRARDELLGRPVAVKLLRPELAADPEFLARFRAEARHAAAVRHPGVAAVHDYGEDGGDEHARDGRPDVRRGGPLPAGADDTVVDLREGEAGSAARAADVSAPASAWLVMDLVSGEPLSTVLAREGRLGVVRTLRVVAGVADALAAAHAVGVVHRDVKPGNLLVAGHRGGGQQGERIVVTDFGIARAAGAASLTRTGTLVGTAAYLSPEQARGRTATAASDLYALGVVAYECLAGRKPFGGESDLAVALAHGRDPVPPLPADVPAPVRALVLRLLAKDPQQRPATAAAVAARARLLAEDPATSVPASTGPAPAPTVVLPTLEGPAGPLGPGGPDGLDSTDGSRGRTAADGGHRTRVVGSPAAAGRARRPALLLAAAGGALLLGGLATGALLAAAHAPAPTGSPGPATASATPAATVRLDPARYVGRPADQVRAELVGLGLGVRLVAAAGDGPVGTVAALDPSGVVARGTTITVTVVQQVAQPDPRTGGQTGRTTTHGPKDEHGKKSGTRPGQGDRKGEG